MARGSQINLFGVGVGDIGKSLNVTASSRINLYYDIQPAPGDKSMVSVMHTPGATAVSNFFGSSMPAKTCRAVYTIGSGTSVYAVYGTDLYVNATGLVGALSPNTQADPEIVDNGTAVVIACGDRLYHKVFAIGGAPTRVYFDSGSTYDIAAASVTFLDGYFIAATNNNGINTDGVYVSALYDGSSWSSLDFAKAESSPDQVIKVCACNGLLYVFGEYSTEVWQNVGDPNYPFQPIQGAKFTYGLKNRQSAVVVNDMIYGFFRNKNGEYGIYRINGLQFELISTPDMSAYMNQYSVLSMASHSALTYSVGGHNFYQITFKISSLPNKTFLYDDVSGTWSLAMSGGESHHIGGLSFSYDGAQYVTEIRTDISNVYKLSADVFSDQSNTNRRVLVGNHIFLPDRGTFRINSISLDMEHGVSANDVTVKLSLSRDGGHTFGEEYTDTSSAGEYSRFFQFNRLGRGRDVVPKIEMFIQSRFVLIGAVAEIAPFGW